MGMQSFLRLFDSLEHKCVRHTSAAAPAPFTSLTWEQYFTAVQFKSRVFFINFQASDSRRPRCYPTALEDRNPVLDEAPSVIFLGVPALLLTHEPIPRPFQLPESSTLLTRVRSVCVRAGEQAVNLLTQGYYLALPAQLQRLHGLLSPGEHPASHTSCSSDPSPNFCFQLMYNTRGKKNKTSVCLSCFDIWGSFKTHLVYCQCSLLP